MKNTWITSDPHLGHDNSHGGIVALCGRPFDSIAHNDAEIISRNNQVVGPDDDVINLGDVAYRCSAQYVVECLHKTNGKHKILLGNHDKPLRQALKRGLLDNMIKSGKLEIWGTVDPNEWTTKRIKLDGYTVILSHHAHRTWPNAFRKAIHLYGHSHSNLPSLYRSMDVGVDDNNFYPHNWNAIKKWADNLSPKFSED